MKNTVLDSEGDQRWVGRKFEIQIWKREKEVEELLLSHEPAVVRAHRLG